MRELNLNCDFSKSFCDWNQELFKDEIDFTRKKGKSLVANFKRNSGPLNDRFGDESMHEIKKSILVLSSVETYGYSLLSPFGVRKGYHNLKNLLL